MNRKVKYAALALIFLLILIVTSAWIIRSDEQTVSPEAGTSELKQDKINSADFPWSVFPGKITEVKRYRETYDTESQNWVAGFLLKPAEAKKLEGLLFPVPSTGLHYRCALKGADWLEETDLCDADKMQAKQFKGYLYNPVNCEGGCNRTVILWVNESTGQSYIVGAPRS